MIVFLRTTPSYYTDSKTISLYAFLRFSCTDIFTVCNASHVLFQRMNFKRRISYQLNHGRRHPPISLLQNPQYIIFKIRYNARNALRCALFVLLRDLRCIHGGCRLLTPSTDRCARPRFGLLLLPLIFDGNVFTRLSGCVSPMTLLVLTLHLMSTEIEVRLGRE